MRFPFARASCRAVPFLPLVLLLVASVLGVLPAQAQDAEAQTADVPDASLPSPIDDAVVVAPVRRQVEQPSAKPINPAAEADKKREAADREAWQQARSAAGGDAAEKPSPDKTLQSYQAFLKAHPDLHSAVAVEAGIRMARLQEAGLGACLRKEVVVRLGCMSRPKK